MFTWHKYGTNMNNKILLINYTHYIRHKVRDCLTNIQIIESIQDYYSRCKKDIHAKHLCDISYGQNWSLLIINSCTIFERNNRYKVYCLGEILKIINSYKRLSNNQKRRKEQIIELDKGFGGYYKGVVKSNKDIRDKCLAHNDSFRKKQYKAKSLEEQKQLIEYVETYLSLVGEFMGVRTASLSKNRKLENCLFKVLSRIKE
jgi:hypothetical protein